MDHKLLLIRYSRHITISVSAAEGTLEQDFLTIDVGPDMTIADLKAVIQSDTNVPAEAQAIYYNGRELRDEKKTLNESQIKPNDMLQMFARNVQVTASQEQRPAQEQARDPAQAAHGQGSRPPAVGADPEMIRLQALADADILARVRSRAPELAEAVSDPARFREEWDRMQQQSNDREAAKQREIALLNEDPFNVEAQAKIEEMIRQQAVEENLQNALDYNPEGRMARYLLESAFPLYANLMLS